MTPQHISDDEVITILSSLSNLSAVAIADRLNDLRGELTQSSIVFYFKRAFPAIPLKTLTLSTAWSRVTNGELTDDGFNEILSPWLGPNHRRA